MNKPTGRGGPGRGQGRKANEAKGFTSKRIVIHVANESEYKTIIKTIKNPRDRTEILLGRKHNKKFQATATSTRPESESKAKGGDPDPT